MTLPNDLNELQTKMRDAMRAHWKAFLIEGILLAVMGLAALLLPQLAGLAVAILLGWLFLITGIGGLVVTFWAREMPGFWWSLISAALAVLAGGVLLARPMQGVLTLTIVVGAYFLAEGVATILYALEHRRELSERWSWLLITGAMDIVLLDVPKTVGDYDFGLTQNATLAHGSDNKVAVTGLLTVEKITDTTVEAGLYAIVDDDPDNEVSGHFTATICAATP